MSFGRILFAAIVASLLMHPGMAGATAAATSTAIKQERWAVDGLEKPARIVIDHWGIPHIFAASARDAFFVQGYNAARDRLWQIDLWRKRGLGLLAKSFGAAYVDQDRAARLFLYRGDMTKEWAAYAAGTQAATQAFVAGINAYAAEVRAGKKPLPPEFRLTGTLPDDWQADDVVRIRSHALVANLTSEVARARVVCAGGVDADRLRRKLEPAHALTVPEGLDPCDVTDDVLKDYKLATEAVSFAPPAQKSADAAAPLRFSDADSRPPEEGSNNWVISPSRSATGRAILANDPHRQLGVPALRYIVQLNAPGLSIIGAGEPALPGVSFGHNDRIGWGLTIFGIDQEDLYVYTLKPGDPDSYRYGDGYEAMRVVHETIEVRGEAPRPVDLRFTRHGPVLFVDAAKGRAFAIRTVWNEPGVSGYLGSSRMWRATSWNDFRSGRDAWGAPPLNLVYADVKGNIGWAPGGITPVRPNWDGLMPVPGDGRYEWKGFLRGDLLPSSYNPKEGWFATANEMNLPQGYPAEERRISFEWSDPTRITRIKQVLGGTAHVSLADSMALQTDSHSAQSERVTRLLAPLSSPDPAVSQALSLLKSWDHDETVSSAPAAIYEVWLNKHLGPMLVNTVTPPAARKLIDAPSPDAVITYLEHPDAAIGADPAAARDALLLASLAEALAELRASLGPDMAAWSWGRLHHATFEPAIAARADPTTRAQMSMGPLQVPGSASSPRAATYRMSDFAVTAGASVRMVLDVGNWDNSVAINSPGQSGDPYSAHYRDLFPLWAAGDYVPLLYSRSAVEREAETVLTLTPLPKAK
ncbi:MAG TPA: penicillin acylase family protein [Rhizomicrobium sp.]|nr:penicillin acylase family protein [Rhizomicrobium sp.]